VSEKSHVFADRAVSVLHAVVDQNLANKSAAKLSPSSHMSAKDPPSFGRLSRLWYAGMISAKVGQEDGKRNAADNKLNTNCGTIGLLEHIKNFIERGNFKT